MKASINEFEGTERLLIIMGHMNGCYIVLSRPAPTKATPQGKWPSLFSWDRILPQHCHLPLVHCSAWVRVHTAHNP